MSVINQMLKDLDNRQMQSRSTPFLHAVPAGNTPLRTQNSIREKIYWGIILVCSALLVFFLWQYYDIDVHFPVAKQEQVTSALSDPSFRRALEHHPAAVQVTGADWTIERSGRLGLLLQLSAHPAEDVVRKQQDSGETEFILPAVMLSTTLPVLNLKTTPLESYRVSQRDGNLVLSLLPTTPDTQIDGRLQLSDSDGKASWLLTVTPAVKKPVAGTASPEIIRKPVVPKNTSTGNTVVKQSDKPVRTVRASYERALRYLQINRVDQAVNELQKVLGDNQRDHAARELLANLYLQSGRSSEAGQLLQQGITLDPGYLPFTRMYADSLVAANELEQAATVLRQAEMYAQRDADFHAMQAAVAQRLAQHAAAVSYYMKALETKPDNGAWWMGMAISLETLNKKEAAAGAYATAVEQGGLNRELLAYVKSRLRALERAQ